MNGEIWEGTPEEWEQLIDALLMRKHGPAFRKVPDRDGGDGGIESFTTDDCTAYQCYAAEEPLSTALLYEKQRDKLTADINKFIGNRRELQKIFGTTVIKTWLLVVPRFESSELIKHANRKAKEVQRQLLPYVGPDFSIGIVNASVWAFERAELTRSRLASIRISAARSSTKPNDQPQPEFISNLRRKIKVLMPAGNDKVRNDAEREFLEFYLNGESVFDQLHSNYPLLYADARAAKENQEMYLSMESRLTPSQPAEHLQATLRAFKETLIERLGGVSIDTIEALSWGTLAGWLLHCPLDFIEKK